MKEVAVDNRAAEFDKNGGKFSKGVENNVGKKRNCPLRLISPFSILFPKGMFCRHLETGLTPYIPPCVLTTPLKEKYRKF